MSTHKLSPGRLLPMIMVGRRSSMFGQDLANRRLCDWKSAFDHLANNARKTCQTAIVDSQNLVDFPLADPRAARLLLVGWCAIRRSLLVAFEPSDETLRGDDPLEQIAAGDGDLAHMF